MIALPSPARDQWAAYLGYALFIVLGVRFLTLGIYPLTDTTEARYAEIARVMLTTGNWITPQLEPGSPFWGKPPLYAWLTALSFAAFGVNEFAARLPQFGLCLVVLWIMGAMRSRADGQREVRFAQLIAASSFIYFVASGAVMTDMALLVGTTMAMVGFWRWQRLDGRIWQALFFLGLAVGLLAKGPLVLVLTTLPLLLWLVVYGRWQPLISMSWTTGVFLVIAFVAPWYVLAELNTPGFLNYFLLGEHFLRFIQPGWAGDLYGNAHDQPRGMIWLYWVVSALPWTPLLVALLWRKWRVRQPLSAWHGYLLCWTIAPMLFFSFAGNILPAYVLPGLPAFAWLVATLHKPSPALIGTALIAPIGLLALLGLHSSGQLPIRTEKPLIEAFDALVTAPTSPLHYLHNRPMSAAFYSRGRVKEVADWSELPALLDETWVAARHHEALPDDRCEHVASDHRYKLWRCQRSQVASQ